MKSCPLPRFTVNIIQLNLALPYELRPTNCEFKMLLRFLGPVLIFLLLGEVASLDRNVQIHLLSQCLGIDTIARQRAQVVLAGRACSDSEAGTFIPTLTDRLSSGVQRVPPKKPDSNYWNPSLLTTNNKPHVVVASHVPPHKFFYVDNAGLHKFKPYTPSISTSPHHTKFVHNHQFKPSHQQPPIYHVHGQGFQYTNVNNVHKVTQVDDTSSPSNGHVSQAETLEQFANTPVDAPVDTPVDTPVETVASGDQTIAQHDTYRNPFLLHRSDDEHHHIHLPSDPDTPQYRQEDTYRNPFLQHQPINIGEPTQIRVKRSFGGLKLLWNQNPKPVHPYHVVHRTVHRVSQPAVERHPIIGGQNPALRGFSGMQTRMDNITCVMRAMGLVTEDLTPNYSLLRESLIEMPIPGEVLAPLSESIDSCREAVAWHANKTETADNRIQSNLLTTSLTDSLRYFKCVGQAKLKTCFNEYYESLDALIETGRRQFQSSSHQATSDFGAALDDVESLLNGRTSDMIELALI